MIHIKVFDLENNEFFYEEYVVNTSNYSDAIEAYCLEFNTTHKTSIQHGAIVLANKTVLALTKIRKNKAYGFTKIKQS